MDSELNKLLTPSVKRIFKNMIDVTQNCLDNIPNRTFTKDLACETALFSNDKWYTYHTHPNGNPKPSEVDKKTTKRFGKQYLMIGLIPQRKVVIYSRNDNFNRLVAEFKV